MMPDQISQTLDVQPSTGRLNIVFYADPLCCWSFAFMSVLNSFAGGHGLQVSLRYCMGGMIPDWQRFSDPVQSVSRPFQMGAVWMEAAQLTGLAIDGRIWATDPPASSFPACIAVKCAELQSPEFAGPFLWQLQQAVMLRQENISRQEVLLRHGEEFGKACPAFNAEEYKTALIDRKGYEPFRKDLEEVKFREVGRFPSLRITSGPDKGIFITGYRSKARLDEIVGRTFLV